MRKIHSTRSGRRHAFVARLPLAAAIHLACFAPAFAVDADQNQTAAPAAADNAKAKKDSHELQTITVTAQKRTENAQDVPISMDVLSSQASIAGYKAVLLAANTLPKYSPMFMTAAGSIAM